MCVILMIIKNNKNKNKEKKIIQKKIVKLKGMVC